MGYRVPDVAITSRPYHYAISKSRKFRSSACATLFASVQIGLCLSDYGRCYSIWRLEGTGAQGSEGKAMPGYCMCGKGVKCDREDLARQLQLQGSWWRKFNVELPEPKSA